MVELFSPVGDMASFRAAIKGGADAVYLGLKEFSMRHSAKNFSLKQVERMVIEAHENKINVYITLNTIIFDKEIKKVEKIIKKLKQIKVDAVICSDSAIINLAKKYKLSFIVSTQCSIANKESAKFYKKLGAKQVVLARELNLKQIKEISKVIDTEVFIHGAMCMAHSGRCFLSHQTIQKSANRGRCVQNCRRNYNVFIEDKQTNDSFKIGDGYILSAQDLCLLPYLDKLVKAGVKSLKIEGRSRNPEYVYTVTKVYREALNAIKNKKYNKKLVAKLLKELNTVYNRGFSKGFITSNNYITDFFNINDNKNKIKKIELGIVENFYKKIKVADIRIRANNLKLGDKILFVGNKTAVSYEIVKEIRIDDEKTNKVIKVNKAKKGQLVSVKLKNVVRRGDLVYIHK